jgi:hypothetical protein
MSTRTAVVGALVVLAASVLVAGVVGAGFDWSRSSDELNAALADGQPTQIAEIAAADGLPARGVFARLTSTGHFCLSDAPIEHPNMGGGGCNPADDPLGGQHLSVSLAYDGGPELAAVRDARLIGLATDSVSSLRVLMTDGSSRAVKLKKAKVGAGSFKAFGYRFKRSDLRNAIGPTAVVAFDASGVEIGRQTTGIG